ncbi:MAG: hypothetical protein QG564_1795 [Campylobacterota bacterium]|nr:hypothetical protein [Campylobacterota bacterium]
MKIDLMSVIYNTSMVLLAFGAALVLTKTFVKWIEKKKEKNKESYGVFHLAWAINTPSKILSMSPSSIASTLEKA